MGPCGGGFGGLAPEFARRIELELVYAELRELLDLPPSREVFVEQHRRECELAGARLAYRETLTRVVGGSSRS